jgi:hypothetical protein
LFQSMGRTLNPGNHTLQGRQFLTDTPRHHQVACYRSSTPSCSMTVQIVG